MPVPWGAIASVAGGALTGLLGGDSGSVTQQVQPWKPAQPYLQGALGTARNLFQSPHGSTYYPFSTAMTPSNQTEAGLLGMEATAAAGLPGYYDAATQNLTDTLSGNYLNNNPYLDELYSQGSDRILDQVNSVFGASGRTGSGYHQNAMANSLAGLYANLYGGNYANERNNMMQGMMMVDPLYRSGFAPSQAMLDVGGAREGYAREQIADMTGRYDFYNQSPYDKFGQYLNAVTSIGGMGGTTTESEQLGVLSRLLGGSSLGLGVGKTLGLFGGGG